MTFDFTVRSKKWSLVVEHVFELRDNLIIFFSFQARTSTDVEDYLLNPFGLLYSEVTASSLVKVDVKGNVLDGGSTSLGISKAALVLHSAIHSARKDVKCIIHIHQYAVTAVSISIFLGFHLFVLKDSFKKCH